MNAIVPISTTVRAASAVDLRPLVRIVIVGHVDHGKSTLIGRLLYETNSLPDGKLEQLKAVSARRGMPFEWSFVLDALQTERDQNITIDTSQIRFRTRSRDFILIDAPGHAEFLRNMITGAAQADAAILVIDATEGVRDQTRRHGYLLQLLGLRQVVVVINKMDRIAYDATRFREIETEITDYLRGLGLSPADVIPVSARDGVGITQHTYTLEWYRPTVVEALDKLSPARTAPELPLRFPVQAVYKFDDRRILAGRIESGRIAVGDEIVVQPSGARTRVKSIEAWPAGKLDPIPHDAAAGQSIGITLEDALFVERGNLVSRGDVPAKTGNRIRARVFWLHSSAARSRRPHRRQRRHRGCEGRRDRDPPCRRSGPPCPDRKPVDRPKSRGRDRNHAGSADRLRSLRHQPATGRVVLECDGRIAGGGLVLEIGTGAAAVAAPRSNQADQLVWLSFKRRPLVSPRRSPGFLPFSALPGCGKKSRAR